MFYYKYFCQTIQCPQKEGGRIPPSSDISSTEKHADVTRVKIHGVSIIAFSPVLDGCFGKITLFTSANW